MLQTIVPYLNNLLSALDYTERRYGLCVQLIGKEGSFPAAYESSGNYEHIDYERNVCYHRLIGEVEIERGDEEESPTTEEYMEYSYPMRCVTFLNRGAVLDYGYEEDIVGERISSVLYTEKNKSLNALLGADSVHTDVVRMELRSTENWEKEFVGIDYKLPSSMIMLSHDYTITVRGLKSCLDVNNISGTNVLDGPLLQGLLQLEI